MHSFGIAPVKRPIAQRAHCFQTILQNELNRVRGRCAAIQVDDFFWFGHVRSVTELPARFAIDFASKPYARFKAARRLRDNLQLKTCSNMSSLCSAEKISRSQLTLLCN